MKGGFLRISGREKGIFHICFLIFMYGAFVNKYTKTIGLHTKIWVYYSVASNLDNSVSINKYVKQESHL